MSNTVNSNLEQLLSLSTQEVCHRLQHGGTPTLDLSSLGIAQTDPVLVNNGSTDTVVSLSAGAYFDTLTDALPLFYKSERAFAERMDGLSEIHRAEQSAEVSVYPTFNQEMDLVTSSYELAAKLALIRRRLHMLGRDLLPSVLAFEASPGTISLYHAIKWTEDEVDNLVKELTQHTDVVDDIDEEIEVLRDMRVAISRTFHEMSKLLLQAMDNGIAHPSPLTSAPA